MLTLQIVFGGLDMKGHKQFCRDVHLKN